VEERSRAGQVTDDSLTVRIACWMTRATNTLIICNTHCFSTATVVACTHISVMIHVHCLSYSFVDLCD
jgi:hypothetical protein